MAEILRGEAMDIFQVSFDLMHPESGALYKNPYYERWLSADRTSGTWQQQVRHKIKYVLASLGQSCNSVTLWAIPSTIQYIPELNYLVNVGL